MIKMKPNEPPKSNKKKEAKAKAKAYAQKIKSDQARMYADQQARMKRFENDPGAKNAVLHMTTPKGYDSDPLKSRGPQPPKKKKGDYAPGQVMPKFK